MKVNSISQLFEAVQLVVFILSENDAYQKKMNAYGFVSKRVQKGHTLLEKARQKHYTQEEHYNHSRRLSLQIVNDRNEALDIFRDHVAIAKSAFRGEKHILQELKISKISHHRWGWVPQAIDFYSKTPVYMEKLQQYGARLESFEQNKAAAEALIALKAQRLKKKGDAENSTQQKTQSIKDLKKWYGEFRKLARIAFQDTPQVLEAFGMVIPSTLKKTKKTAPAIIEE